MYLIYGESFRLIEEEIAKIIKEETNIISLDMIQLSLEEIIKEATYVSLFHEKKILIVRNANFFSSEKNKEEDLDIFYKYMENPIPFTTILFITFQKIDTRRKVYKEFIKKNKVIILPPLSNSETTAKIKDLFLKKNYKVESEILQFLINACANNYDLIYNECQKIFLYYSKPQQIQEADVKNIVSKSLTDNNFKFVEAVISRNISLALKILEDLILLKVDPIALIMLLAREYRMMICVYTLQHSGYKKTDICKNLKMQDWQVEKIIKETSGYYIENLKKNLKNLAIIDYEIKSGKKDKFLELKLFLLRII